MPRLSQILALFSSFTLPTTAQADAASVKAAFDVARSCFVDCVAPDNTGRRQAQPTPKTFANLLKDPSWSRIFVSFVKALPPAFLGFALNDPNEEIHELKMEGTLEARVRRNGRVFYIYEKAGLPSGSYKSPRRPVGNLSVIVDSEHKEIAGLWNGTDNLDQYQFVGSKELLGVLVAYEVAREAEEEKSYLVSVDNRPDSVVLPLPNQRKTYTQARLDYLDSKLFGAGIFGARSPLDAGDDLRNKGKKTWFVISTDAECIRANSPASKIQEIRDNGLTESTEDGKDESGTIVSVAVSYDINLTKVTTTYYTSKSACDAALLARNAIPSKYQ